MEITAHSLLKALVLILGLVGSNSRTRRPAQVPVNVDMQLSDSSDKLKTGIGGPQASGANASGKQR